MPQPYTPFPEEEASQKSHPFPLSLVSVEGPAAQRSWGKHPPQKAHASLLTTQNTMTKQNSINRKKCKIQRVSVVSAHLQKRILCLHSCKHTQNPTNPRKELHYHIFQSAVMPIQIPHYLCCSKHSAKQLFNCSATGEDIATQNTQRKASHLFLAEQLHEICGCFFFPSLHLFRIRNKRIHTSTKKGTATSAQN